MNAARSGWRFRLAMRALETATTLVPLSPAGQRVLVRCYFAAGHRDLARQLSPKLVQPAAK